MWVASFTTAEKFDFEIVTRTICQNNFLSSSLCLKEESFFIRQLMIYDKLKKMWLKKAKEELSLSIIIDVIHKRTSYSLNNFSALNLNARFELSECVKSLAEK